MAHEHRYAGFNSGGKTERRCQGCFALEPEASTTAVPTSTAETRTLSPKPEAVSDEPSEASEADESDGDTVQADSESATLRRKRFSRRTDG